MTNKKTAKEILLEDKKDKWTHIETLKTGFVVRCNRCGKEQGISKYIILSDKDECFCTSKKGKEVAKKEARQIFAYMVKEILGYGLLEGEELEDYIRDILRIESALLAVNEEFCNMVIEAMKEVYKEREVQRCVECGKLYPASRLYKKACLKKFRKYCVEES